MRDIARIARILDMLHAEWVKDPDQRFGQLLYNIVSHKQSYNIDLDVLYELEDDVLEKALVRRTNPSSRL